MRVRVKKSYDRAFKVEALSLLQRSDKTMGAVAASLGIPSATLLYWYKQDMARRRARNKEPATTVPGETLEQKLARLEQENAALRKENEDLRVDRDILKKAAAYSTGHRNTTTSDSWLKEVVTHAGSQTWLGAKRKS